MSEKQWAVITRMSHTTYNYTRDRLGFDPGDREEKRLQHYAGVTSYQANGASYSQSVRTQSVHHHGASNGNGSHYQEDILTGGVYEENLEKFRGSCHVMKTQQTSAFVSVKGRASVSICFI